MTEDNVWPGGVAPKRGPVFMQLSDSGQVAWCKRYGGSTIGTMEGGLLDLRDTSLLAVGRSNSNDYYFTGNHLKPNGQPSDDAFVVKVDKNGDLVFSKLYGTEQRDDGFVIDINAAGGYTIAGAAAYEYAAVGPPPYVGNFDLFITQVDGTGLQVVSKIFGSAGADYVSGVLTRNSSRLLVGTIATPPFSEGTTGSGGHPQGNIFVSRMDLWPALVDNVAPFSHTLTLVPNPARGEVVCMLPDKMSGRLVLLYSDRRLALQKAFKNERELHFSVSSLPVGAYQVAITGNGGAVWTAQLSVP